MSPKANGLTWTSTGTNPAVHPDAWHWNSGFQVKSRIDKDRKIWYAEMRIPFQSISRNPATPGLQLRINFFRTQGSGPNRLLLTWRPTHARTFHVPAAFGTAAW